MIRSAKDIPAEIKSIVGKFYMNNVEKAKEALVQLRIDKPEYNSLLDNVEQLFENAPESVFTFYDELIALDKMSEVISPEIDFSIDSLMDDDDEVKGSAEVDDDNFKLNLDDEEGEVAKKTDDDIEMPELNLNFALVESEDSSKEDKKDSSDEEKDAVKVPLFESSEDKHESVKSCFSEVMEQPSSEEDDDDDKPFDISACLIKSSSSESESEKSSDDDGIKLVGESGGQNSESDSATESIELNIDFDDNDAAFKMPSLFADDDEDKEKAEEKSARRSSNDDDFSFSKVLEVPKTPTPVPEAILIESSADDAKSSEEEKEDKKDEKEVKNDVPAFDIPIIETQKEEKKAEGEEEEVPFFPLIGKIDTKKSSDKKDADKDVKKDDAKDVKKDDKDIKKDDAKDVKKDDKDVKKDAKDVKKDDDDIDIPIFDIGALLTDDSKKESKEEVKKESKEEVKEEKVAKPIKPVLLPTGSSLKRDNKIFETATPIPNKILSKKPLSDKETATPIPNKILSKKPLSDNETATPIPNKILPKSLFNKEKEKETATPIPNKILPKSLFNKDSNKILSKPLSDKEAATPIPEHFNAKLLSDKETATPIPNKITDKEQATPVPEFMKRTRVSTREGQADITPIPEQISGFRKISAFSDKKASEHKTAPALQAVPSASFFGVSVASLDEIKSKLGESPKKPEPVKKFEPLKKEEPVKKPEPVKKYEPLKKIEPAKPLSTVRNDDATPLPGFQNSKLHQQKVTSIALNAIKPTSTTTPSRSSSGIIATDPVARLRPLSRIPRLVCKLSEIPKNVNINPKAGFLLSMIDGRTTISDILDISAWPEEETARLMLELEDQDVIFFR